MTEILNELIDLTDDPITSEALEADLTQQLSEAPQQPEEHLEADTGAEGDREPSQAAAEPGPEGLITIDGQTYRPEELEPYLRSMKWATENPARWQQILEWERRGYVLPEQQAAQAPPVQPYQPEPDEDDYVDPHVTQVRQQVERLEAELRFRQDREDQAAINEGVRRFRGRHQGLTEGDWERVARAARDWNLVSVAVTQDADPVQAVDNAFERAWRMEFFEQAQRQGATSVARDLSQARRAAATSSAPRTTARTEPEQPMEFKTPADLDRFLAQEIRQFQEANE